MDSAKFSAEGTQERKNQLEILTKEELVIKCRNLLVIAKKAKTAKDDALEEVKNFKAKLSRAEETLVSKEKSLEVMKEDVENLTQHRETDSNKIDILNKSLSESQKNYDLKLTRLHEIEIEKEALKRQLQRFSDENDRLLMLLREKDSSEISEQNEIIKKKILLLEDIIEKNSFKIKSLIQENSKLKEDVVGLPKDQLKVKYDKCIEKLKMYREKIYDISEKLSELKNDREILLKTSKEYSQCISKWQTDISYASVKIAKMNDSNKQLSLNKKENEALREKIAAFQDNETMVNDLKLEIQNLKETLTKKEKELNEEKDACKKIKQINKKSVLDLEIEAYEKTLDELNKKLEVKKLQEKEFENTIQIQVETIESLKSQIKSLAKHLESEKNHSSEVKKHLDNQQNLMRKTEHERTETNLQFELLTKSFESLKLENSEIRLQMSNDFGVLQKRYQTLEEESDGKLRFIASLENDLEVFKKLSSSQEKEIEDLRTKFASYKLRAQSVLKSQTKDLSKELELQEEIKALQKTIENIQHTNVKQFQELESFKKSYEDLSEDKIHLQKRCKELIETIDEASEESKNRNQVHDESIKTYQQQIESINAFYKKKIQETEIITNSTMKELQEKISKLEKSLQIVSMQTSNSFDIFQMKNEENKTSMLTADREDLLTQRTEAEGSEDQSSHSTFQIRRKLSKNTRELLPLDQLLNTSFDNNLNEIHGDSFSNYSNSSETFEQTKSKLMKEENRVAHLTSLLAESEKDFARLEQLNEILKEEIRRQQRNTDREEHVKNSEYLKNIVIKFVTLSNGDEKQRLIPVLNTILKLNSEENSLLQNTCKSSWSGLWNK